MNNKDHANLIEVPMPRIAGFDLSTEMAQRPYAVLGLGVLAGYVLGGGIFSRLTGRVFAIGLRAVGLPLITQAAINMVQDAVQGPASVSEAKRAPRSSSLP